MAKAGPAEVDAFLSAALRSSDRRWPAARQSEEFARAVIDRALYHGIAGLLAEGKGGFEDWPTEVASRLRGQAVAQAMWEMRHKLLIAHLLDELAREGIRALLLKGTALAYDLYRNPAARSRGDTDLLIDGTDLARTRDVLTGCGFSLMKGLPLPPAIRLQEPWTITSDGAHHVVDLHWQAINSPALRRVISFTDAVPSGVAVPRLSASAKALDHPRLLLHAIVHRAMHITAPYLVDGIPHYGGDRLIWSYDMHLLASGMSRPEWDAFAAVAEEGGVAAVCAEALSTCRHELGTDVPDEAMLRLSKAVGGAGAERYLRGGQLRRHWLDFAATRGLRRKLHYLWSYLVPSQEFLRGKYPTMAGWAVPLLFARRVADLLFQRRSRQP